MAESSVDWKTLTLQKILIMCLGDAANLLSIAPAFQALKQAFPQSSFTLLTTPHYRVLSTLFPFTETLLYPFLAPQPQLTPATIRHFINFLHAKKFQIACFFTADGESPYFLAYLCYLAGIPIRWGESQEFGGNLLSPWIKLPPVPLSDTQRHLFMLRTLELCSIEPSFSPIDLAPWQEQRSTLLKEFAGTLDCPFLLLDPLTISLKPQTLALQTGYPILSLGTNRHRPQWVTPHKASMPLPSNLTTFPKLALLIQQTAGIFSADSELIRLANLFNRPLMDFPPQPHPTLEFLPENLNHHRST